MYDKQKLGQDRFCGGVTSTIMAWIQRGAYDGSLDLKDKEGKAAGSVALSCKFERPSGPGGPPGPPPGVGPPRGVALGGPPPADEPARDPNDKFTDKEIREAFEAFDLDHNSFVGAAEIRHVLINIGENVTDEEVDEVNKEGVTPRRTRYHDLHTTQHMPSPSPAPTPATDD